MGTRTGGGGHKEIDHFIKNQGGGHKEIDYFIKKREGRHKEIYHFIKKPYIQALPKLDFVKRA